MACLFKDILDIIGILSLIFEEDDMVIYDVMTQVHMTKDRLQELKDECKSSSLLLKGVGMSIADSDQGVINIKLPKLGQTKIRNEEKQMKTTVQYGFTHCNPDNATASAKKVRDKVITALESRLDTRFNSFENPVLIDMAWIDPALWKDAGVTKEELSSIFRLVDHFQHTLESANLDRSKLKYEWKELKHTVKFYYRGVPATLLWPRIFQYSKVELAWHSGNVMDCHATARVSIPARNGVFIELHVLCKGH